MQAFKERVREIVRPIGEGKRTAQFTPRLLNLTVVEDLIKKHPKLNNSIYRNHPSLIYTASTVTLAQASSAEDPSSVAVHLILNIPILREQNIYHYYRVEQTGITQDNSCWKMDVPRNIYIKPTSNGTKYFSLDEMPCDKTDESLVRICSIEDYIEGRQEKKSFLEVACLNGELTSCQPIKIGCKESSVYSTHGLMTRSDNRLTGVNRIPLKGKTVTVWEPENNPTRTMYWSWKDFKSVDMKEGYVSAADYQQDVSFTSIADQETWWRLIRSANTKYERENVTKAIKKLNDSFNEIDRNRKWFDDAEPDFTLEIVTASLLGIALIVLSAFVTYCLCNRCKHARNQPYSPVNPELELTEMRDQSVEKESLEGSPLGITRKRKGGTIDVSPEIKRPSPSKERLEPPSYSGHHEPEKSGEKVVKSLFRYSDLYGSSKSLN